MVGLPNSCMGVSCQLLAFTFPRGADEAGAAEEGVEESETVGI